MPVRYLRYSDEILERLKKAKFRCLDRKDYVICDKDINEIQKMIYVLEP